MTNSKSTKRALLLSALSILMCVAMLVGTTFAWFTDTASTAVNKIQAGTLDVALEMWNGTTWVNAERETLNFKTADGRTTNILWEPGCTYDLVPLRVVNNGNLALKFEVVITGINGDAKLNEAIEWDINYGEMIPPTEGGAADARAIMTPSEMVLLPGNNCPINISGHMYESAGNEYQGLSIDGIAITVFATQTPYEYDSYDKLYDEDAPLPEPVNGQADLSEKLNTTDSLVNLFLTPGTYTLPAVTNKQVIISGDENTVIDMATSGMTSAGPATTGLDITFDGVTVKFNNTEDYKGIYHSSKVSYKDCTIYGKQFLYASDVEFVNCTFINPDDYSVWTYGANNATFENCTFVSGGKALLIYTEDEAHTNNVTVNNCTFNDNGYLDTAKAAIEIGDSQPVAGLTVNLVATNNKIYGFANNNDGTATGNKMWGNKDSIPADRLIVTASNNTEYDATVAVTDNATIVAKALKAPTETISVTLTDDVSVNIDLLNPQIAGSGEYRLGGTNTNEINIDLNGHKLTLDTNYMSALGANNFDAVINVKNGSINSTQSSGTWETYDLLFANCTWNFKDVTFDKAVAIYTNATATMNNVIINDSNDVYALWITAGAKSVTLNEVTTNCPNGRAIAIKDQYVDSPRKVTLSIKDSTFSSAKKAAVLVTNTAGATINADNVDISNVSADNTNLVWVDNGASYQNISNVTVTGCTAIVEP